MNKIYTLAISALALVGVGCNSQNTNDCEASVASLRQNFYTACAAKRDDRNSPNSRLEEMTRDRDQVLSRNGCPAQRWTCQRGSYVGGNSNYEAIFE